MGTYRYIVLESAGLAQNPADTRYDEVPALPGSTLALPDGTPAQPDTYSYWPYEEVTSRTGTTPPLVWGGAAGYREDSTRLIYVRVRY